jgi:hypothetical protein
MSEREALDKFTTVRILSSAALILLLVKQPQSWKTHAFGGEKTVWFSLIRGSFARLIWNSKSDEAERL